MKVKTTFSTILTLMCVLMFSFAANAEKNYSFHNHPSRPSKDANELFMKQYLGVVADGYTTGNAYEYVQVGTETGTDYLVPRHFVKNNSGSYYVTFGPKKDGDYNDNYEYVGSGGTQTVYKAGKTSASGSTRCNDVAASFTTTNPNLAGIEKVWAKQSVPKINYAKSFQPYQEGGKTITGPSLVAENQVVIFEVNQYWRGARQVYGNDKGTVDGTDGYRWSNEWNQCYYGIENIITEGITETAIPASSYTTGGRTVTTQGGTLYGYTGELGRFFFAKRRANNEETNGYKTDYSTSGNNYREMLLRWYNEWSTVDDQKKGWDGFSSSNHWDDVMGGDVYRAPHNCSSSLETNHFISLYGMDSEGTKKPLTILFYIDKSTPVSTRDITDVSQQPFMFGYYGEQLELSKQTTTVEGKAYDIKVTFRSNYNTVRPSTVPFYDAATRTGVTEYFDIWRKKADGTYEKIEENLPSNSNKLTEVTVSGIKYYQYLDKGFEDGGEAGYDVEYYIVPSLWHVSPKSGSTTEVTQDAFVAKTATGTQTIHIAGTEALILYGSTTSQFTASKFENKADTGKNPYYESDGTNKNEGKHILKPVSDCSTKMGSNDKVVLVRIKGTQETILKTGTTGSGKTVGKVIQEKIGTVQDSYPFDDNTSEATYVVRYVLSDGTVSKSSNPVTLNGWVVSASAKAMHRQGHPGHPDAEADLSKETIHNEIQFTTDPSYPYYEIWKNGSRKATLTKGTHYTEKVDYVWVDEDQMNFLYDKEAGDPYEHTNAFYNVIGYKTVDGVTNSYGSPEIEFDYSAKSATTQPVQPAVTMWDYLVYQMNTSDIDTKTNEKVVHETHINSAYFGAEMGFSGTILKNDNPVKAIDITTPKAKASDIVWADKLESIELYGEYLVKPTQTQQPQEQAGGMVAPELTVAETKTVKQVTGGVINVGFEEDETGSTVGSRNIVFSQVFPKVGLKELGFDLEVTPNPTAAQIKAAAEEYFKYNIPQRIYAKLKFENDVNVFTDWSKISATSSGWTGIDDVNTDDTRVSVYPNPATDYITVEGVEGSVALFSTTGAQVAGVNGQGTVTIDVSGLSKGVYVLKTGNVTEKILIK